MDKVDVLAVMHSEACALGDYRNEHDGVLYGERRLLGARAAVAELIEAATYATCGDACQHNRCAKLRAALARVKAD